VSASTALDEVGEYTGGEHTRRRARRLFRWAGLGCGLLYGLGYALAAWAYDAWVLARSQADLPWARLEIGLPILLLVGAVTGALAGRSERAGVWVGVWMAGGALSGLVAGHAPFAGSNLATWVAEPRLRGVNVYPLDPTGAQRTTFVVVATACMGAAVGLVGHVLAERVLHLASQPERRSRWGWAVLLLCLPLALLPGLFGDEVINRPLRVGRQAVVTAISAGRGGDRSPGNVSPYQDLFPGPAGYILHLVGYDRETPAQATVDVAFDEASGSTAGGDSGPVVRCQTSGDELVGCASISSQFEAWMGALVQRTRQGEQGAAPDPLAGQVLVGENTMEWLASQREYLSDIYVISRDAQRGGWVIASVRFDTGYVLTCYFHDSAPVVVDRCTGGG